MIYVDSPAVVKMVTDTLRSWDPVHLTTAEVLVAAGKIVSALATYDRRQAAAVAAAGIAIRTPGRIGFCPGSAGCGPGRQLIPPRGNNAESRVTEDGAHRRARRGGPWPSPALWFRSDRGRARPTARSFRRAARVE